MGNLPDGMRELDIDELEQLISDRYLSIPSDSSSVMGWYSDHKKCYMIYYVIPSGGRLYLIDGSGNFDGLDKSDIIILFLDFYVCVFGDSCPYKYWCDTLLFSHIYPGVYSGILLTKSQLDSFMYGNGIPNSDGIPQTDWEWLTFHDREDF